MSTEALQTRLTVVAVMWSFKTGVSNQRDLIHLLKPFSVAFLQNSEEQIVQDP